MASISGQTLADWELIIVDDGSTDGTAELAADFARRDPRVRVVRQANLGIAKARNRGLDAISSSSRYVALLDHDDVWMPNTLELLRDALLANPSASGAHGRARAIDASGRPIEDVPAEACLPWNRKFVSRGRVETWPLDRPTEFATLAYDGCIASVGSALIRRSALDRVGGFDWRAEPADDYDLWVRLSRIGPIVYLDVFVLAHRQHAENRSWQPPPPRGRGTGYVRRKLVRSKENTPEQRRVAIDGFRAHEKMLIVHRWSELAGSLRRREYAALPRQVVGVLGRAAAYARGHPWRWQR